MLVQSIRDDAGARRNNLGPAATAESGGMVAVFAFLLAAQTCMLIAGVIAIMSPVRPDIETNPTPLVSLVCFVLLDVLLVGAGLAAVYNRTLVDDRLRTYGLPLPGGKRQNDPNARSVEIGRIDPRDVLR
jgi:hypothetical protein